MTHEESLTELNNSVSILKLDLSWEPISSTRCVASLYVLAVVGDASFPLHSALVSRCCSVRFMLFSLMEEVVEKSRAMGLEEKDVTDVKHLVRSSSTRSEYSRSCFWLYSFLGPCPLCSAVYENTSVDPDADTWSLRHPLAVRRVGIQVGHLFLERPTVIARTVIFDANVFPGCTRCHWDVPVR